MGVSSVWRISFAIAGVVGAAESVFSIVARGRNYATKPRAVRVGDWLSLALYILVAAIAIRTALLDDAGIGLKPLEAEGILLALLLFLGVNLASLMLVVTAPRENEASA